MSISPVFVRRSMHRTTLHGPQKEKPRYCLNSAVFFVYLGWLMGLTSHIRNQLIFKDFSGGAVDFDGKA